MIGSKSNNLANLNNFVNNPSGLQQSIMIEDIPET